MLIILDVLAVFADSSMEQWSPLLCFFNDPIQVRET